MAKQLNENEPSVGSKEVAEERQRSLKMRQLAVSELNKQKDPNEVVQELVAMGMEETKAAEMVNGLLNEDDLVVSEEPEIKTSKKGITDIIIGVVLILCGVIITWVSYSLAAKGVFGSFAVFYGFIVVGIGILLGGIIKNRKYRKNNNNNE